MWSSSSDREKHAMASYFDRKRSAPFAEENVFDGDPLKYRRFIEQFEVCTLRGIHDSRVVNQAGLFGSGSGSGLTFRKTSALFRARCDAYK